MNPEQLMQFLQLVQHMRNAQRLWFKTREKKYLIDSKQAEMLVDLDLPPIIQQVQKITMPGILQPQQEPTLFDNV